MPTKYITPTLHSSSFNCPRCGVLCQQLWYGIYKSKENVKVHLSQIDLGSISAGRKSIVSLSENNYFPLIDWDLRISVCNVCNNYTIWHQNNVIFPNNVTEIPDPSEDTPDNAKEVYEEARSVFIRSPRAAAALLRLSIEMVLKHILNTNKSQLNELIEEIVKRDIPEHIQKSLDVLRYYGNKGIHAGEINLNDDRETVIFLFDLANIIIFELITRKKNIDSFYSRLPESFRNQIERRDG